MLVDDVCHVPNNGYLIVIRRRIQMMIVVLMMIMVMMVVAPGVIFIMVNRFIAIRATMVNDDEYCLTI